MIRWDPTVRLNLPADKQYHVVDWILKILMDTDKFRRGSSGVHNASSLAHDRCRIVLRQFLQNPTDVATQETSSISDAAVTLEKVQGQTRKICRSC